MTSKDLPTLNRCVEVLMGRLVAAQDALRRAESISGKGWNPRRCNKLRDEIASLERRLKRAEQLQEQALSGE